MKLYLLRHDERALDDISFYSPLIPHGLDCANKLKYTLDYHNINLIFCSPFKRTLQTVKPYCDMKNLKLNIEYSLYEKLNNINDTLIKKKYDLCTVARLEYRKGHHLVFEAMSILRNEYKIIVKYAILGDGPELSRLKDLVLKFSLQKQVDFIHHDVSSEKIFKNSSVHIMPTITTPESIEGFGISNVEAASYGLPCIVSNSGGTPESIGNNGIIVKENNPKQLVKAIIDIFKKYKSYSRKSYLFANNFESNKKIKEYLNAI